MKLSIIICAYNEARGIRRLLHNLTFQQLPPEVANTEIIVVASGCTDGTIAVVKAFMAEHPEVTLIEEADRRGKASAMNRALAVAAGDVIVSIPADVVPVDEGLYHLLLPFRDPAVTAVSGKPMERPEDRSHGFLDQVAKITYAFWEKQMKTLNDAGVAAHSSGEFMAMRAGVVTWIPEECAAEDSYISVLARRKGFIKFVPEAVAFNRMPANIRDYVNQRRRWLFGHFQTHRLTGEYPTVMDTLIFYRPHLALRIIRDVIQEAPQRLLGFVAAAVIEAGIYALAVIDRVTRRQYAVWPIIQSTKDR